jgi:KRAB domain-containing zinc finger protein
MDNNDVKTKLEVMGRLAKKKNTFKLFKKNNVIVDLKREFKTDIPDEKYEKKHKRKKPRNESASESVSNDFVCNECGKQFMSSKNLKAHMNVHAEQLQYQCHHCGAKLRYHKSLRRHMDLHMGDMNIPCDFSECTEKFKTKKQLDIHLHQHTDGKRSYTCSLCGKSFSLKKVLIQHYKIHGERSFKCSQCPLAFTTNARLRVHSKVHTG